MKSSEKVSIVITTYGRAEYLKKLVYSIRKSTPEGQYEIVIVSSDPQSTEKILWLKKQPDIKLISADIRMPGTKRKKSLYHYTNLGIIASHYPWILVVNDDMSFDKKWYTEFVNILSNHQDKRVAQIILASHIGDTKLGMRVAKIGKIKKSKSANWEDLYLADVSIIKRSVLKKIGYFDENMDWYGSGLDNALAINLMTDQKTLIEEKIKINHFITQELRQANNTIAYKDFSYVHRKWKKWCKNNDCQYDVPFDIPKPSLLSHVMSRLGDIKSTILKK